MKKLDKKGLQRLLQIIEITKDEEYCCDECYEHLDKFAELIRAGKPAAEIYPRVQQHLEVCLFCKEEFETLLKALDQTD
jgi:hypothetical protein